MLYVVCCLMDVQLCWLSGRAGSERDIEDFSGAK